MWPFKCRHPFHVLAVEKDHTAAESTLSVDYEIVTYHLFCRRCGGKVKIEYARKKLPNEASIFKRRYN